MVDQDIATYIHHRLQDFAQLKVDPKVRLVNGDIERVRQTIYSRGQGLFLYARLMIDNLLDSKDRETFETRLNTLPDDLNDMYSAMLEEHATRSKIPRTVQVRLLRWVTHSTRPMRLIELADMLCTIPGYSNIITPRDAKSTVRAACGPLLEILEDGTTQVIHHSFTEYLLGSKTPSESPNDDSMHEHLLDQGEFSGSEKSERRDQVYFSSSQRFPVIKSPVSHEDIVLTCIKYLSSGCFKDWCLPTGRDIGQRESKRSNRANLSVLLNFPLLKYAGDFWDYHARHCNGSDSDISRSILDFLEPGRHDYAAWLDFRNYPGDFSPLHAVAKVGLAEVLSQLIAQGFDLDMVDKEERTPLSYAAEEGFSDIVSRCIEHGAKLDADDRIGNTPIHYAAMGNHYTVVRLLLEAGADPLSPKTKEHLHIPSHSSTRPTKGETALYYSCTFGHLESVEELLKFIDPSCLTTVFPLHWAAATGSAELISLLLKFPGVEVNSREGNSNALFIAAACSNAAAVQRLLENGVEISFEGRFHSNALHAWTIINTRYRSPKVSSIRQVGTLLIEAGADINAKNYWGKTPLHCAVGRQSYSHDLDYVSLLSEKGADPSIPDSEGSTPLHDLRQINCEKIIDLLVKSGANLDAHRLKDGKTPLLLAIDGPCNDDRRMWRHLLARGADPNAQDLEGNGALHAILTHATDKPKYVKRLLDAGANPKLQNTAGETCIFSLFYRADNYQTEELRELMAMLNDRGSDLEQTNREGRTVVLECAARGELYSIRSLLDFGVDVTKHDKRGRSIMHLLGLASSQGNLRMGEETSETISQLIASGADAAAVDHSGATVLHHLVEFSSPSSWNQGWSQGWGHGQDLKEKEKFIEEMIGLGADPKRQDFTGQTILHKVATHPVEARYACGKSLLESVVQLGIDIGVADNSGCQALHLASSASEFSVQRLLQAGADARCLNGELRTPLHFAARARQVNIIGLLCDIYKGNAWDVDQLDIFGRSAFHDAARSGRQESVAVLLECGANPATEDKEGRTPLDACTEYTEESKLWDILNKEKLSYRPEHAGLPAEDPSRPLQQKSGNHEQNKCRPQDIVKLLTS